MKDTTSDLNQRIAERVRELRAAQGLSLDALAGKSGVSRSMISLIERGESSPTAVVLEKLAAGLGVTLASLFDASPLRGPGAQRSRRAAQRPAAMAGSRPRATFGATSRRRACRSRCRSSRCTSHPAGAWPSKPARARPRVHQQIWVLEGAIDITLGEERHRLREGDCLAMQLDRPTMFHNPTRKPARYAVVIASEPPSRR